MVGGVKAQCNLSTDLDENTCPAKVGEVGFDTADTAMAEVKENGGDFTLIEGQYTPGAVLEFKKNATVDTGDNYFRVDSIKVDEGVTLTLKGSNIVINKNAITVEKGATLIIDGAKITATTDGFVKTSGTVTVNTGSEINAGSHTAITANSGAVVTLDGTIDADVIVGMGTKDTLASAANITVNGGKMTATNTAFNMSNSATLTINGGEIKATNQAILMTEATVNIINGDVISTGNHAVQTNSGNNAKLTISGGKIIAAKDKYYALYINNPKATYELTAGTLESKGTDMAAILLSDACLTEGHNVVAKLQGIITGGSYLNKIVATVVDKGGNYDVSTQLVKAGVEIKTENGYKVVGEGTSEEQTEEPTAPESQEATGNTADAKNPGTSDNFMSLVSLVSASAAGLFIAFKKLFGPNGRWR